MPGDRPCECGAAWLDLSDRDLLNPSHGLGEGSSQQCVEAPHGCRLPALPVTEEPVEVINDFGRYLERQRLKRHRVGRDKTASAAVDLSPLPLVARRPSPFVVVEVGEERGGPVGINDSPADWCSRQRRCASAVVTAQAAEVPELPLQGSGSVLTTPSVATSSVHPDPSQYR